MKESDTESESSDVTEEPQLQQTEYQNYSIFTTETHVFYLWRAPAALRMNYEIDEATMTVTFTPDALDSDELSVLGIKEDHECKPAKPFTVLISLPAGLDEEDEAVRAYGSCGVKISKKPITKRRRSGGC